MSRREIVEILRPLHEAGASIPDIVDALSVLCMIRASQEAEDDETCAQYERSQALLEDLLEDTAHMTLWGGRYA